MVSRSLTARLAIFVLSSVLVILALTASLAHRDDTTELTTYVLPNKYDKSVENMQEELQRDSLLPAGAIGAAHHVLSSVGGRLAALLAGLGSSEKHEDVKQIPVGKLDHLLDEVRHSLRSGHLT
eukprot:763062-Hanusia_phi.AAC.1